MRSTTFLRLGSVALLLGCDGALFSEQPYCHHDCPVPPTIPPVVAFLAPTPGARIDRHSILSVSARDDKQLVGVEFYYGYGFPDNHDWVKLHPGIIAAPPYNLDLSRYQLPLPTDDTFVFLHAVAKDIEGNADTATVLAQYALVPPP